MSDTVPDRAELLSLTTEIVAGYLSNNVTKAAQVADLIQTVFDTLNLVSGNEMAPVDLTPAVPIRKSVTDDYIVCLEDGRKLKILKRHLMTAYGMTPDEYRRKWGLKHDYPMVAPGYAAQRAQLAKKIGLGRNPAIVEPGPGPKTKRRRKTAA